MAALTVGHTKMTENQGELGLDTEDAVTHVVGHVAFHIVQAVVGGDVHELFVRNRVVKTQEGGFDDGKYVKN